MQEFLDTGTKIAHEAGVIMREYFGLGLQHTFKLDHSPLTVADEKIHQLVVLSLEAAYPDHSLLGEEGRNIKDSPYVWVFDPIDGTAAFLRGVPTNVFSLALVKDGVPLVGVVYDPYSDLLYTAIKGEGAFMNGLPISTSAHTELAHSYVEIDGQRWLKGTEFFERCVASHVRFLSYSSTVYAHMMVATGQLQGAIFPPTDPWDCAAAKVIVEEAGGVTSDLHGNEQRYDESTKGFVSAGNVEYHTKLLELIESSV
jgi:histidinol-phosphatase